MFGFVLKYRSFPKGEGVGGWGLYLGIILTGKINS
jgi:hypothetical protein